MAFPRDPPPPPPTTIYLHQYSWQSRNELDKFEVTNEVSRNRKSKKNRQYNGKKNTDKRTNNDLVKKTIQKTTDRATCLLLKPEGELINFACVFQYMPYMGHIVFIIYDSAIFWFSNFIVTYTYIPWYIFIVCRYYNCIYLHLLNLHRCSVEWLYTIYFCILLIFM